MNKKLIKLSLGLMCSAMLCGGLTACSKGYIWTHYAANEPTEAYRGNVEFWVNQEGDISLGYPNEGKVEEGGTFDRDRFAGIKEIWIENELKITNGEASFVIPMQQLPSVYNEAGKDYSNAEFKMLKDVTLNGNWTALGTEAAPFKGKFDGNNKTISGLKLANEEYCQGLFGAASGATFKNVKFASVDLNTHGYTGALVGFIRGGDEVLIENCHVLSGSVKSTEDDYIGGLVGGIYEPTKKAIFKDCSNAAKVETAVAPGRAGGMVGGVAVTESILFENCVNKAEIVAENSSAMVGGTRGTTQGATFTFKNCRNEGTATVPYIGFLNSSANSQEFIKVKVVNTAVTEAMLPTLFGNWQSGGTEGGILSVDLNGAQYKYFLIPTYTYSDTQGKIVSLSKVNSVSHPLNKAEITVATEAEWAEFMAINPKAAIYNEDGSYKGVSPTTNCYAPNSYYIKGAQFGGYVNSWVKIVSAD